jgi:phi13 family phage major tail protein
MDGIYGEYINVGDMYIAKVLQDDASGYLADTVRNLAPMASVARDTPINTKNRYYSGKALFSNSSEGATKLTIVIPGLSNKDRAEILGKLYIDSAGRQFDSGKYNAPYYALGYKNVVASSGAADVEEYFWFLKGKFAIPKQEAQTMGENVDEKALTLEFTGVSTVYQFTVGDDTDNCKLMSGDTSDAAFDPTGWFDQVQTPTAATPDALALSSSSPADGASGSSKTAAVTLTFNNRMDEDNVHVVLMTSAGVVVTVTPTWDAAGKVMSLAHAALAGSTAHLVSYVARDVYGQTLTGAIDFTTAV